MIIDIHCALGRHLQWNRVFDSKRLSVNPAGTTSFRLPSMARTAEQTLPYFSRPGKRLFAEPGLLVWASLHGSVHIHRQFLDQQLQDQYADTILQTQVIGLDAAIALVIAGVGLFALATSTAERRTKEIGIRKAMGASPVRILRLLARQFSRPVLWANLIAWPVA